MSKKWSMFLEGIRTKEEVSKTDHTSCSYVT
jgi:hypothetical protein